MTIQDEEMSLLGSEVLGARIWSETERRRWQKLGKGLSREWADSLMRSEGKATAA